MALVQFEFKSATLKLATQVNLVFSEKLLAQREIGYRSPVLYLLHGLSHDHSSWLRKSCIERYVDNLDVVVVMPSVHRSFYRNTYSGYRYFDFVSEELPQVCERFFPISQEPQDRFVAGVSMGGFGAFKLALSRPAEFAAAASLSGPLDLTALSGQREELFPEWAHVFGPQETLDEEDDLIALAQTRLAAGVKLPRLLQSCGTEDYLFPVNALFQKKAESIGLAVETEFQGGAHNWDYWDPAIRRVLKWLPLRQLESPVK